MVGLLLSKDGEILMCDRIQSYSIFVSHTCSPKLELCKHLCLLVAQVVGGCLAPQN